MAFEKGHPKAGGRKKGGVSKTNAMHQHYWQGILDRQTEHIENTLTQVREEEPAQYLKIIVSLTEFVMPKLARTELTGLAGKDIRVSLNLNSEKA